MHEKFSSYSTRFEHIRMSREEGILTIVLHSDGGPLAWNLKAHLELSHVYRVVGADPENRCIILTGSGDTFIGPRAVGNQGTFTANPLPYQWDITFAEARRMNLDMLEIPVPMIAAVNGPCYRHGNMALMCDIVLAADTASWEDKAHFSEQNLVPGDGVHVIYPLLLGINRARYFLLTGQVIDALEAKQLGLVNEVLPAAEVMPRAIELARFIAEKPAMVSRSTRQLLTHTLKRDMHEMFGLGVALEGFVGKATQDRSSQIDAERAGEYR